MNAAASAYQAPRTFTPLETWLATLAGLTAFFTGLFTASMVNVAVPSVMGSFGVGQSQAQLLLSAFLAMNSTGLLASSWMVARFGQREVFLGALATFGCAGLFCFIAPTFEFLVLGRVVQGMAAGLLQPLVMMVLVQVFPPQKRGLAMGMFSMGVTAAVGLGPAVGGLIIESFQWRLIFLAPIPFTLLAAGLGFFFLPALPRQVSPPRFDWLGFVLVVAIVFCWFTILGNGQRWGWSSDRILLLLVGVLTGLALFFWSQRRVGVTLIDLSLFKNRTYAAGFIFIFFYGFATLAVIYAFPVFGQVVQNLPPINAGALLLPGSIIAGALMPFTGRLTDVLPARTLLTAGLIVTAISSFALATADTNTIFWYIAFMLVISRIGSAIVTPPMMTTPLLGLPPLQMPRGAGLTNFAAVFGGANGIGCYVVLLEQRIQFHATNLGATQNFANESAVELLRGVGGMLTEAGASAFEREAMAIDHLNQMIVAQANALGFQDGFLFIGLTVLIPFIPLIFMKNRREVLGFG